MVAQANPGIERLLRLLRMIPLPLNLLLRRLMLQAIPVSYRLLGLVLIHILDRKAAQWTTDVLPHALRIEGLAARRVSEFLRARRFMDHLAFPLRTQWASSPVPQAIIIITVSLIGS